MVSGNTLKDFMNFLLPFVEPSTRCGETHSPKSTPAMLSISSGEVQIGDKIGGGGVGLVHRGWYQKRPVAVKTLFDARVDDQLRQEYMNEVSVLRSLRHPNIVEFLGANMLPPDLFFVMELCESSLFNELHIQHTRYNLQEQLCIAIDAAGAMLHLHQQQPPIIHRDLKSANCLLTSSGSVKLCDFGLVHSTSTSAGTPAYMAPELLQGRPFNLSVDVYAFGMILWELFAEDIPFRNFEVADIKEVVISGERPAVPRGDTPQTIRELMSQCWQHTPQDRPAFDQCLALLRSTASSAQGRSNMDMLADDFGGDCLDSLLK